MIKGLAWNPIGDILGGIGDWFTDVLRNTVSALIQGVSEAVKWVSTYFLYLPAPVLQGEGGMREGRGVADVREEFQGIADEIPLG